jgi:hypothetical protein
MKELNQKANTVYGDRSELDELVAVIQEIKEKHPAGWGRVIRLNFYITRRII